MTLSFGFVFLAGFRRLTLGSFATFASRLVVGGFALFVAAVFGFADTWGRSWWWSNASSELLLEPETFDFRPAQNHVCRQVIGIHYEKRGFVALGLKVDDFVAEMTRIFSIPLDLDEAVLPSYLGSVNASDLVSSSLLGRHSCPCPWGQPTQN